MLTLPPPGKISADAHAGNVVFHAFVPPFMATDTCSRILGSSMRHSVSRCTMIQVQCLLTDYHSSFNVCSFVLLHKRDVCVCVVGCRISSLREWVQWSHGSEVRVSFDGIISCLRIRGVHQREACCWKSEKNLDESDADDFHGLLLIGNCQ